MIEWIAQFAVRLAMGAALAAFPLPSGPADPPEVMRLVAQMERAAPSSIASSVHWAGWEETPAGRLGRYHEIARAAWSVAGEPGALGLFGGARAREKTAAGILAVAFHESGFSPDVDAGPCYRGPGQRGRCDSGRAFCMMQIQMTHGGRTPEGHRGRDLFASRELCFRVGLRQLAGSQAQCGTRSWAERFGIYASGRCDHGGKSARELGALVDLWAGRVPR